MYQITVSEEIKNACPIFKGAAVTGLISHGPDQHAGTVFITHYIFPDTVYNAVCPVFVVR